MKSRKLLIGCGIALLALGVVVIGVIASFFIPKTNQQLPSGAFSILVNINLPLNGAELPLNEPVSIYAEAVGDKPVHSLELWVDGAFSPTKMDSSPADKSPLSATWLWTPTEEGVHRLVVRATGPGGEVVNSNVVRVSVLPREKIADLLVTDIPAEMLPPNETPAADVANQPSEEPTVAPPPPPFPPQDPPQVPSDPPVGAPGLQGSINQCDATLLIQDNADSEKGFYLYRFDPTSTGFTRVATLDKHPSQDAFTYLDAGLSLGNHTYYISSFDGNGEYTSNLINLKVTAAQCAGTGPQAIGLQDAILKTNKAVDKVYCYLSVDQGPWKRIPPGSNKFIFPSAGGFDLGKYLNTLISPPPPGGVTLELECWGWSGNSLVYLGYLKQAVGKGPVQLNGTDFILLGKLELSGFETFPFILSPNIAPPHSVTMLNDLDQCTSILSELFVQSTAASSCKNMLDYGWTILSWKWEPGCPFIKVGSTCPYTVKDIDGYHIYRISPGMDPVQISYTANGSKFPWAYIAPTNGGGIIPPQYFVRAYKGVEESADSVWVNGLLPKYTVKLTNPKLWTGQVHKVKTDGVACPDAYGPSYFEYPNEEGYFWVGYEYRGNETTSYCYEWYSKYLDGHVVFDLSSIKGQVTSAILRWKWKGSFAKGEGVKNGLSKGCWIPLTDQNGAIIKNYPLWGPNGYDVTTQVRAWVQGSPNKGFAFLSGDRQLIWAKNEMCEEKFGDFELEVTYIKQGKP